MSDNEFDSQSQGRIERLTEARRRHAQERTYAPFGPIPVAADSFSVRVIACTDCGPNGRGELDPEDPEDRGIRGCCEGYAVRLEVTPGLEPLVLRMAAAAAGGWAWQHRLEPGGFSDSWTDEIEDEMLQVLALRPPHREGASVLQTWSGSTEEAADMARVRPE